MKQWDFAYIHFTYYPELKSKRLNMVDRLGNCATLFISESRIQSSDIVVKSWQKCKFSCPKWGLIITLSGNHMIFEANRTTASVEI